MQRDQKYVFLSQKNSKKTPSIQVSIRIAQSLGNSGITQASFELQSLQNLFNITFQTSFKIPLRSQKTDSLKTHFSVKFAVKRSVTNRNFEDTSWFTLEKRDLNASSVGGSFLLSST